MREHLQVLRRVGDALADLGSERVDGSLALRQDIDDLGTPAIAERLRHRREGAEKLVLGLPSLHAVTISSECLNVKACSVMPGTAWVVDPCATPIPALPGQI